MSTLEPAPQVLPPSLTPQDVELARAAQRCIEEALDRSRAASILLSTTEGEHPPIALPPAALKLIGQVLGLMSEGRAVFAGVEHRGGSQLSERFAAVRHQGD
jgi:hypothetical protein